MSIMVNAFSGIALNQSITAAMFFHGFSDALRLISVMMLSSNFFLLKTPSLDPAL